MRYKLGRSIMFFLFDSKKDKPLEFSKWIVKTDETRIENASFYLESTDKWIKTEKLEADDFSAINPKVKREGFVYRSLDGSQSFKNVSREYLLKYS